MDQIQRLQFKVDSMDKPTYYEAFQQYEANSEGTETTTSKEGGDEGDVTLVSDRSYLAILYVRLGVLVKVTNVIVCIVRKDLLSSMQRLEKKIQWREERR